MVAKAETISESRFRWRCTGPADCEGAGYNDQRSMSADQKQGAGIGLRPNRTGGIRTGEESESGFGPIEEAGDFFGIPVLPLDAVVKCTAYEAISLHRNDHCEFLPRGTV